jgi:3-hydroxyisobutyrate dehydrogenase-like beta-hydroxyacid dehydrogenase
MENKQVVKQSLGFVGVGRMGSRMVKRLIQAGYSLTIFDTSEAAVQALVDLGATRADSPVAVASAAEIVFASLPTPPIVQNAALGPQGIIEGTRIRIFIDVSTTGSIYAKRIAEGLAKKGFVAVDAPISGGFVGAEMGTVAVMVSCSNEVFEELKPILEVIGKLFHVGKTPGQGQTMKLLNNILSATAMTVSSEILVLGVKAGLDPGQICDVINAGTGRNSATADKIPRCVIPRKFDSGFAIGLLNKDVRMCLEEAEALGVPMIVGSAVRQLVGIAAAEEGGDKDMTITVRTLEKWAGIQVSEGPKDPAPRS